MIDPREGISKKFLSAKGWLNKQVRSPMESHLPVVLMIEELMVTQKLLPMRNDLFPDQCGIDTHLGCLLLVEAYLFK